jgi:type I pantothenate kinase
MYDIVPGEVQIVSDPDIVIVEGLNVLQTGGGRGAHAPREFVSDFFDFSIYVDADDVDLEQWYVARFFVFRDSVFTSEHSYFHQYAYLSNEEIARTASEIWRDINLPNLHDNILPTRERAHLILEKGPDHTVRTVRMRKL